MALIFLTYLATSVMLGQGDVVLPLDDTYIHFQYARQLAEGQPYVYNPGDPPTSGATSFLYPYVLALGYAIGFQGLSLGLWAMGVGALALLTATWMVFLLARVFALPRWLAAAFALLFALSGAISWHYMSGMETGLVITFTLLTLYMVVTGRSRGFALAAALLALSRPEGSIMAMIAVGAFALQNRVGARRTRRALSLHLIPLAGVFVQPLVNFLLTGSASSTGGQAKTILGTIPFYWDEVIRRILENFSRMWVEFLTGTGGDYTAFLIAPLALVGWLWLMASRERRVVGLMLLGWFVAVSGAIATLDTAFWHFKRYQMPLMALLYPLAAWGMVAVIRFLQRQFIIEADVRGLGPERDIGGARTRRALSLQGALVVLFIITFFLPTLSTSVEFLRLFRVNVANVMAQPLPMARWLRENTPEDAIIAVHDVGIMRYIGERYTLDMVGLTTSGAAEAWRNGPGAVAEFLDHHEPPPDYVAAYTTARGLNYLADTDIYGDLLAGFTAQYNPAENVALGAEFQGIYRYQVQNMDVNIVNRDDFALVDSLNVANIASEAKYRYYWHDDEHFTGFSTEVYEFGFRDGGRRINGEERFTMQAEPGKDGILITRVHPANSGTFEVVVGDEWVDTQWIPAIPGRWLEIATLIPAEYITNDTVTFRILPNVPGGHYMPYYHWWLQGEYTPLSIQVFETEERPLFPVAAFQEGAFSVFAEYDYNAFTEQLRVTLAVDVISQASGDYKAFIHLYDAPDNPPAAQGDGYVSGLPGNWLPGITGEDFTLDLAALPPGTYTLAIGFYDSKTLQRLEPQLTGEISSERITIDSTNRRVFIGEVEVTGDG